MTAQLNGVNVESGVLGASGRMGQTVVSALSQSENVKLTAAVVRAASSSYGKSERWLQYTLQDTNAQNIDVLIDFSLPEALDDNLFACKNGIPIVVGTTGLTVISSNS